MIHHQNSLVRPEKKVFFPGIVGIGVGEAFNSYRFLGEYVSPLGWRQFLPSHRFRHFFRCRNHPWTRVYLAYMSGKYCQNMPWCFARTVHPQKARLLDFFLLTRILNPQYDSTNRWFLNDNFWGKKSGDHHLGGKKKAVANNGINYQPQLVSLPDFWTSNSMFWGEFHPMWRNISWNLKWVAKNHQIDLLHSAHVAAGEAM